VAELPSLDGIARMSSRKIKFIGIALLAVVAFVCLVWWWLWSIPFSQTTLKRLTPGMSEVQVVGILGAAGQTNQASNGETWWIYDHPMSIRAVIVMFDVSGHLKEYVVD
jgi:hypothetical protein